MGEFLYGPAHVDRYRETDGEQGHDWQGTTVLLLDDAEGNTWIMKGFQLGLKPQKTYEEFVAAGAGNFKQLPPGWKFRISTDNAKSISTAATSHTNT